MKKIVFNLISTCLLALSFTAFAQSGDNMKQDTLKKDDMKKDDNMKHDHRIKQNQAFVFSLDI